jgi:hypothetical protein
MVAKSKIMCTIEQHSQHMLVIAVWQERLRHGRSNRCYVMVAMPATGSVRTKSYSELLFILREESVPSFAVKDLAQNMCIG